MKRLLITGAAGGLGRAMRSRLAPLADTLRLADIAPVGEAGANEEVVTCDLADAAAVHEMVAGCDGIVHFGGVSVERPFDEILNGNIIGLYNLYEAARTHGHPRILFASSNHTVGFHPQDKRLTASDPMRPDSLYGVSKCYGEALASMYHDKFGQETLILRIGSSFPKPANRRMLSTWLSYDDLARLITRMFEVPRLGRPIVWGASDNPAGWWDNGEAGWLGWRPQDSAEAFRAEVEAAEPLPARDDPAAVYQGGAFCVEPIHKK
ncbi:NAD-dependent epimerase/dehydratase family protein [Acidimangrovimonas sediminis]|uniref:NAD-dependent epimerase/dehydratase family protein n=1 Tax=Acidimangrovimonas sediminis TaxID=2056283 RepID=UPI000C8023DE|nr:NAD(P)-dependent oxidoreductase [Acidimangrovimonas sediminis]